MKHQIVTRNEWLEARKALLLQEKDFSKQRDKLSAARRELPWVAIEDEYIFDTNEGVKTLNELFGKHSQLIIYHFMIGDDWKEGCKSCSFWADNFNGIDVHLAHRDIGFLAISRASLSKINSFKSRMGWDFNWVSSAPSNFNRDFDVSFDPEDIKSGNATYNYRPMTSEMDELAGVSVFTKNSNGDIFHTYSTFSRGLDLLNGAYNYIDLTPKGRNEQDLSYSMEWLRHHDRYED